MDAGACPAHPHNRQRSVCRHNSGRYAVLPFLYISVTNSCSLLSSFLFPLIVPLSRPVPLSRLIGHGTMGHLGTLRGIPLFHGLSSPFSCPANSSACFTFLIVPTVPSCPIVPLVVGWDGGTLGTAISLASLLRWIIRLTVDLPQFTCEAISLTDLPDWDSCKIMQSLWLDSLSPNFFRCSFSVE